MDQAPEEKLRELDSQYQSGQLSEMEFKEQKWELLQALCGKGTILSREFNETEIQETTDNNGTEFCYVESGPFVFGPDDEYCELKAPIYISKYPVTVEQFLTFLDDSGYDYPEEDREILELVSPEPDCPVSHVSWDDAKEYCRWLRKINCEYYSLPHEIEWERAARGIDGRFYPWGNNDPTEHIACFREPVFHEGTASIYNYMDNVSPVGCVQMVGNVWEWCLDTVKDKRDPRILRGGSWCNPVDYTNCISRTFSFPPDKRIDHGGFRVTYLPHEMLLEYRRQYAGGVTSKANLTVVTHAKRKKKDKDKKLPEVAQAQQEKAADSDIELNDLMAEAISEAAAIYRRSIEGEEAEAEAEEGEGEAEKPEQKQAKKEKKKKKDIPLVDLDGGKPPPRKGKKGEDDDGRPEIAKPKVVGSATTPDSPKWLRMTAMITWGVFFLAVLGLFIRKLMTLS